MSNAKALEAEAAIGAGLDTGKMDDHMKAMWAGQSNVLVSVRVRPLMKHDVVKKSCVRVLDSNVVVILDPAQQKPDVLRVNRTKEKQYAFDYVFEPSSSQEAIYHHSTKFLIHGVLDGFNATVFAYGQTGSGKTFTMIGTQENPGIMVRVMSDLFVHSASNAKTNAVNHKVTVSFLEVYNENIRDLLADATGAEEYLDLREDPIKGPVVAGITEVEAKSASEIMQLLHQGNSKRSQAATAANEVSSRSHAVLQVVVESRDRAPGVVDNIKVGKLSLIDLAGSERAANTQNRGARLVEGANINRSLLALGNCINALGEKGNKGNFVPYRDSKLTRLLKDSLGGNCRTVMIANISPAESSFEETLNTLKYANRAKNIKTEAKRNVLNVNYHISEYVELINNLRGEIKMLKDQIESNPGAPLGMEWEESAQSKGDDPVAGPALAARPKGLANLDIAAANGGVGGPTHSVSPTHAIPSHLNPSTPMQALRASLKSGGQGILRSTTALGAQGENRELVNSMRQMIVSNFQERMQLRRSLIELEDQNVQNSIEVSKRQLIVVQWTEAAGIEGNLSDEQDLGAYILASAPPEVATSWRECEQIKKAVLKNNSMKRSIAKRLRHNEREAEKVRDELGNKITGEDRRELMELQYQVGRLELENMELEQHRIVHESILKGKDLVIQKLRLQLAVKDKIIARQQTLLTNHNLQGEVGYHQFQILEDSLNGVTSESDMGINAFGNTVGHQQGYANTVAFDRGAPNSPPRALGALGVGTYLGSLAHRPNKYPITQQRLEAKESKDAQAANRDRGIKFAGPGHGSVAAADTSLDASVGSDYELEDSDAHDSGKAPGGFMFTSMAGPRAAPIAAPGRNGLSNMPATTVNAIAHPASGGAFQPPARKSSHHFYPSNVNNGNDNSNSNGAGNNQQTGNNAAPVAVPAPQVGVVTSNRADRAKPTKRPSGNQNISYVAGENLNVVGVPGTVGHAGSKISPRVDAANLNMQVLGQGPARAGAAPPTEGSHAPPNASGAALVAPNVPGPRRAKQGYVPSSWESKTPVSALAAVSQNAPNVDPALLQEAVSGSHKASNSSSSGGGVDSAAYQNMNAALAQAQAQTSLLLARQQEARGVDRRERGRATVADDGTIDTPHFSIGRAEPGPGAVSNSNSNIGAGRAALGEEEPSAAAGQGKRTEARRPQRPMAALGAARSKAAGRADIIDGAAIGQATDGLGSSGERDEVDLEERSVETIYSEGEESDGSFQRDGSSKSNGKDIDVPMTSADRAHLAAQAQVAAYTQAQMQAEKKQSGHSVLSKLKRGSRGSRDGVVISVKDDSIGIQVGGSVISGGISQAQRRAEGLGAANVTSAVASLGGIDGRRLVNGPRKPQAPLRNPFD